MGAGAGAGAWGVSVLRGWVVGAEGAPSGAPGSVTSVGLPSQLAHAIRLLLEYTDSNYEEKKYTMGDGNGIPVAFRLGPNSC